MIISIQDQGMLRKKRRMVVGLAGGSALAVSAVIAGLGTAGFRVNFTPSEPIGLWRIVPLDRSVRTGDLVFICPGVSNAMREARSRGYLHRGLCSGTVAPLIKMVAATSGQVVEINDAVRIDGKQLAHSQLMLTDGEGRQMVPYVGGTLPFGTVYLHSEFPGSFDSRYFGPLPLDNVLGFAQEVWAYGP